MNSTDLSALAGVLLSLVYTYVPQARAWYDALDANQKRGAMLLSLVVVVAAVFALGCAGVGDGASCDRAGLLVFLKNFLAALGMNQATFLISFKPPTGAQGE